MNESKFSKDLIFMCRCTLLFTWPIPGQVQYLNVVAVTITVHLSFALSAGGRRGRCSSPQLPNFMSLPDVEASRPICKIDKSVTRDFVVRAAAA